MSQALCFNEFTFSPSPATTSLGSSLLNLPVPWDILPKRRLPIFTAAMKMNFPMI